MADAHPRRSGFTLVELLIVIAIMAALAGVAIPALNDRAARSRDARRLTDMQTIVRALDEYLLDMGKLPAHDKESGAGGWDTTLDGSFITELVRSGHLRQPVLDPLNDARFHYRFQHYAAGTAGIKADFYVLGLLNFETAAYAAQRGQWSGPGRDWGEEFAFVAGGTSW